MRQSLGTISSARAATVSAFSVDAARSPEFKEIFGQQRRDTRWLRADLGREQTKLKTPDFLIDLFHGQRSHFPAAIINNIAARFRLAPSPSTPLG